MISILISVYNFNPLKLVADLSAQLESSGRPGEIIIGDDSSDPAFMPYFTKAAVLPNVRLYQPPQRLGRSRMRNSLAEMARHPYLLFIDGDASVAGDSFLKVYLDAIAGAAVICGGTAYHGHPPQQQEQLLRWKYGISREARTAENRNIRPYRSFSSFNFLIPREVFRETGFNETISRYGHEDTVFGIDLEKKNIKIIHIDNQLIHDGLDSSSSFLAKTREGLLTLAELQDRYESPEKLASHIRLLSRYEGMRKAGLHRLLHIVSRIFLKSIQRNLEGPSPSLALFDLYKLCILNDIKA